METPNRNKLTSIIAAVQGASNGLQLTLSWSQPKPSVSVVSSRIFLLTITCPNQSYSPKRSSRAAGEGKRCSGYLVNTRVSDTWTSATRHSALAVHVKDFMIELRRKTITTPPYPNKGDGIPPSHSEKAETHPTPELPSPPQLKVLPKVKCAGGTVGLAWLSYCPGSEVVLAVSTGLWDGSCHFKSAQCEVADSPRGRTMERWPKVNFFSGSDYSQTSPGTALESPLCSVL